VRNGEAYCVTLGTIALDPPGLGIAVADSQAA
jgi:hypothetical protein